MVLGLAPGARHQERGASMRRITVAALASIVAAFILAAPAGACSVLHGDREPHGQNVPPAGSTTLPGPKGEINEDGFYTSAATSDRRDPARHRRKCLRGLSERYQGEVHGGQRCQANGEEDRQQQRSSRCDRLPHHRTGDLVVVSVDGPRQPARFRHRRSRRSGHHQGGHDEPPWRAFEAYRVSLARIRRGERGIGRS